jgi:hypothetical protein
MTTTLSAIDRIPGVLRIENCSKDELTSTAMEMTHAVYPHDQVYGQYCTVQDYINCPPAKAFEYLADVYSLQEWTYSLRDFTAPDENGTVIATDRIGGATKIYIRVAANREAMTVDYYCAWDQGDELWMVYLMRVVPARLVLGRAGSVVLWTNCRHPYYDKNPFPEKAPPGRKVWVGDLWPFFYAGHKIELDNLKYILEFRHANGLPMTIGGPS